MKIHNLCALNPEWQF